jgi:DEAD/DEAH box helicase domain-containing protein
MDTESLDNLINRLRDGGLAGGRGTGSTLVHEERLAGREASYGDLRPLLPNALGMALRRRITKLYKHQVDSIQAVRTGRDVVVTTPTASGKSLAFNIPVLERLIDVPSRRALYLYPTKALMNDQRHSLEALVNELDAPQRPRIGILSGDLRSDERSRLIRDEPNVLIANPDIVHHELLQKHGRWREFLSSMDFIVIDELHDYRGVFGSNVALILRRLLRVAAMYGAEPRFIAASATIANPEELAHELVGREFALIDGDGAGAGARRFLIWRPPFLGGAEKSRRGSIESEAVRLFGQLLRQERRVIVFGSSRTSVERIFAQTLKDLGDGWKERISSYRAGYSTDERARIEAGLREGRIQGVVTTNALELGIDIGTLDTAILVGYPGSVMSTWQQAGRVGRRGEQEALVILIAGEDALDQYFVEHPQRLFAARAERAAVNPGNARLLEAHLLCAAAEAPLQAPNLGFFPQDAAHVIDALTQEGKLVDGRPTDDSRQLYKNVSIRGIRRDSSFALMDGDRKIGDIEPPYLQREAYPGAIYLHNGQRYVVAAWDKTRRRVVLQREMNVNRRTEPVATLSVMPHGQPIATRTVVLDRRHLTATLGQVQAVETVTGFREFGVTHNAPPVIALSERLENMLDTIGMWLEFGTGQTTSYDSLHAWEHLLVNVLPLLLLCDRRDVGSTTEQHIPDGGRVILFDRSEGGAGLCESAYQQGLLEELLGEAARLLRGCPCLDGCPACVVLPGCAQGNDRLDKRGALALLEGRSIGPSKEAISPRPPTPHTDRVSSLTRMEKRPVGRPITRPGHRAIRPPFAPSVGSMVSTVLGAATVLEVNGDQVKVRYSLGAWSWVHRGQVRPLGDP